MNIKPALNLNFVAIALMVLMLATRFSHFGTAFSLPDASLAVFFLAGLWLGGSNLFIGLLVAAGLIDYFAISLLGVSDFCLSLAYVFLIPTYAVMWLGGKWCGRFSSLTWVIATQQFTALVLSTFVAFLLSDGSFYLLSGRYPDGSWTQYFEELAMYFPPYLISTLIYTLVIVGLVYVGKSLLAAKNSHEAF